MTTTGLEPVKPRLAAALPDESDGLTWLPAWRIARMIAAREVSPVEVTEHFIARIEELDGAFHAFRTVDFAGARAAAKAAEHAVAAGETLGALHGVPVALKEHMPVAGFSYWNSYNGQHAVARRDGIEAERLRKAGAILIGTTVAGLTAKEFGATGAQPANPWDTDRICGDSSSGCAAATAAALVPASVAVDGLGSTRLPASFCGLVGLNPTRGRIPWTSWSAINPRLLSNAGPLTRDVRDAAIIMQALAGQDGRDLMSRPDPAPDYLARLGESAAGLRLAWSDDPFGAAQFAGPEAAAVIAAVREAALGLRRAGADLRDTDASIAGTGATTMAILGADGTMASRRDHSEDEVIRAKEGRAQAIEWFNSLFETADFLITPTVQYLAPTREGWAQGWSDPAYMLTYTAHTAASNLTGYPALSVPAGLVGGMPVGLQIYGPPDSEPAMFALAQAFLETVR